MKNPWEDRRGGVPVWKENDSLRQRQPRATGGRWAQQGWLSGSLLLPPWPRRPTDPAASVQITSTAQHPPEAVRWYWSELEPLRGDNKHREAGQPLDISTLHPPTPRQSQSNKERAVPWERAVSTFPEHESRGTTGVGRGGENKLWVVDSLLECQRLTSGGYPHTSQAQPLPPQPAHIPPWQLQFPREHAGAEAGGINEAWAEHTCQERPCTEKPLLERLKISLISTFKKGRRDIWNRKEEQS